MNKYYTEFPTVAPASTRIILTADPITGALGKAEVSQLPNDTTYCLFSKSNNQTSINTGANPQTIASLIIPANTFNQDGVTATMSTYGRFLTGTGTKTIDIICSGALVGSISNTGAGVIRIYTKIQRVSASQIMYFYVGELALSQSVISDEVIISFDCTVQQQADIRIINGAANNIKYSWCTLEVYKQ